MHLSLTLGFKILFIFSIWLSPLFYTSAEELIEESPTFSQHKENHLIRLLGEFPIYSFYIGAPDINGVAYVPNFTPRAGLTYGYKNIGVSVSIGLPLPQEEIDRRGPSDQLSFIVSKYWRSEGLDLFYQNYRGFYLASPWNEVKVDKPEKYPQLPDAEILHYGINYYHAVDPSNYSLKAAFSQLEIQNTSGGSIIYTGFVDRIELSRGQKFSLGSDGDGLKQIPQMKTVKMNTFGGGFGYGYTFVTGSFQISGQAIFGAGIQSQFYEEDQGDESETAQIAGKANLNAGIGYRIDNWHIGGKALVDTIISNLKSTQIYSTLVNGYLFVGSRF